MTNENRDDNTELDDDDAHRTPKPWPLWVGLGLWGLPGRNWAWACFWLSIGLTIAGIALGFVFWPAFYAAGFSLAACWYLAAIRWVDRHGQWP